MEIERLYYLGVVKNIIEEDDITKEYGIIEADIPGVIQGIRAFPKRNELDEPKVGDAILLLCLDPILNSYWIYEKIKENDFIGIRAAGKMIDITPDSISIGIFDKDTEYKEDERPEMKTYVKIDSEGNMEIKTEGNTSIEIKGDAEIKTDGDTKIESSGETEIKATGGCTIDSPDVKIKGGKLTVNGQAGANPNGPFCALPNCLFTGVSHSIGTVLNT
jgi:hypothetical protein